MPGADPCPTPNHSPEAHVDFGGRSRRFRLPTPRTRMLKTRQAPAPQRRSLWVRLRRAMPGADPWLASAMAKTDRFEASNRILPWTIFIYTNKYLTSI